MFRHLFFVVVFLLLPFYSIAAFAPSEGQLLNYRLVGFSIPARPSITGYTLEIALGMFTSEDSFRKNIISTVATKESRIVHEVPYWSTQYTWRMVPASAVGKTLMPLHHFSTGTFPAIDSRFTLKQSALKYEDAYVFLDATRALYDMKGRAIWYLPLSEGDTSGNTVIRDLKLSAQHTITYLIDKKGAFEINYNGDSLWTAPSGTTRNTKSPKSFYHHEFTRLRNGHYMALGDEMQFAVIPQLRDTTLHLLPADKVIPSEVNKSYTRLLMGTITEYNSNGALVWSWRSADHFKGTGILYRHNKDGKATQIPPHENSFYFDEIRKCIFLSCRDINRVIKISYPDGNIIGIYGDAGQTFGKTTFCGQHSCRISAKGNLYLYNNNSCDQGAAPSVVIIKMNKAGTIEKAWEYVCGEPVATQGKEFSSGGNVLEMPGGELFVSMAYPRSDVFIVGTNKEILWQAAAEKWNDEKEAWESMRLYRASIITNRKDLEQMIWNSETE